MSEEEKHHGQQIPEFRCSGHKKKDEQYIYFCGCRNGSPVQGCGFFEAVVSLRGVITGEILKARVRMETMKISPRKISPTAPV